MAEVYRVAALRHLVDASALAANQRYDNAGHLVGFAVECALKHAYGLVEPLDESPRVHLPHLVNALLKQMRSRNAKTGSLHNLLNQTQAGFFNDWRVSDRYADDQTVSRAMYEKWRALAHRAFGAAGIRQ